MATYLFAWNPVYWDWPELPDEIRRLKRRGHVDIGWLNPFGYVLVEPGTAERILAGVYSDEELLDEVEAYFDLPSSADSGSAHPRIAT